MLRDAKARGLAVQALLVLVVLVAASLLVFTTLGNLKMRGIPVGIDFLSMPSQVVISESILEHDPDGSHYRAILVGIANTLFISALVIVMSTVLGLAIGLARLSANPLASRVSQAWIEVARNFPPIVILILLYSIWWKVLPAVEASWTLVPGVHLSMRGLNVPSATLAISSLGLVVVVGGLLLLIIRKRLAAAIGLSPRACGLLSAGVMAAGVLLATPDLRIERPRLEGSNFTGGWELSPELTTILLGLTIYTTGFIAEIVRAGVLAIGKGQWEAGRSLSLPRGKILRYVVLPQVMRVIVPPMNSQYINVVKNSTLAIAVGYPDFLAVMNTIISKSSHSIEGVLIILGVYLAINLTLSSLANWYNRRMAIVER